MTPTPALVVDVLMSFVGIPIMVVWFWRGSWLVMDYYLWQFSPETHDVWLSLAWSTIISLVLLFITSETVFSFIKIPNQPVVLGVLGRVRTYLMGWGIVNYWRVVWYIWDESAGTSEWSCWLCHLGSIGMLAAMGCLSCILAPASTLGVDFVPAPGCADEPLFSNLPVPSEDLFFFGIGRNPQKLEDTNLPEKAKENLKRHVRMSILVNSVLFSESDELEKSVEMDEIVPKTAEIKEKEVQETAAWSSGGTGRRASYSSVRAPAEVSQRRSSYFDLQRPDLDRRVGRSTSVTTTGGGASRRSSDLFRSR
jgi:hypothetical protein